MITVKKGDKVIVIQDIPMLSTNKPEIYVTEYIRKGNLNCPIVENSCCCCDYVIKFDEELFSFLKQKENLSLFRKTGLLDKLQINERTK